MVEKFLEQTTFTSQEDFIKNLKIKVPENFNFGYDIVDAWAAEEPDKKALLWTNDKGEHVQYTYADLKKYTDMTASYFQSLGIGHGDKVMLILKRRYEFWYSIIALHKLGAVVIPATHLLTKKDIVYRCNAADIKMIVAAGEDVITKHITDAMSDSPSVRKLVSKGCSISPDMEAIFKALLTAWVRWKSISSRLVGHPPAGASPGRCRVSARKESSSKMRPLFSSNHPRESRPGRVDTVMIVFSFSFFIVIPPEIY